MLHYLSCSLKRRKTANLITIGISVMLKLSDRFSMENTGKTYYDETYTVKTAIGVNGIEIKEPAAGADETVI